MAAEDMALRSSLALPPEILSLKGDLRAEFKLAPPEGRQDRGNAELIFSTPSWTKASEDMPKPFAAIVAHFAQTLKVEENIAVSLRCGVYHRVAGTRILGVESSAFRVLLNIGPNEVYRMQGVGQDVFTKVRENSYIPIGPPYSCAVILVSTNPHVVFPEDIEQITYNPNQTQQTIRTNKYERITAVLDFLVGVEAARELAEKAREQVEKRIGDVLEIARTRLMGGVAIKPRKVKRHMDQMGQKNKTSLDRAMAEVAAAKGRASNGEGSASISGEGEGGSQSGTSG